MYLKKIGLTEPLFQTLQTKSLDVRHSCVRVDSTLNPSKAIRSDVKFQGIYSMTNGMTVTGMTEQGQRGQRPRPPEQILMTVLGNT